MGKLLKPRVLSRPDKSGKRTDITAESIKRSRQRKKEIAEGKTGTVTTTPPPAPPATPATTGKEYVFEFSGPIGSAAAKYVSKLASLMGGKRAYIEDESKLVVVL